MILENMEVEMWEGQTLPGHSGKFRNLHNIYRHDKYSITEQINILENICKRNNWDTDFYQDLGISGETIKERPQIKELIEGCSNGIYSRVLVVDQDRLSRNVKDLQVLKEIAV